MASYRKLPSGKWQASVRGPGGKRHTKTDRLKSVVKVWAEDKEAELRRGEWRDPRIGRITVGEWHDRWWEARVVADTTAERDRKNLDRYVLPHWGHWPLDSITRMEVEGWVKLLSKEGGRARDGTKKPLGAPTVHLAYRVFSAMLRAATEEKPPVILNNPCHGVRLPALPAKKRRYFTDDEQERILQHLAEPYRTLVELAQWSGLRWEELAGLHGSDVDWFRELIEVRWVLTPKGLRPYPKSDDSERVIPVPGHIMQAMAVLLEGRDRGGLVFRPRTGPERPVHYQTFYWHWRRALEAAGVPYARPHTNRHTAASRLVQMGVPIIQVQHILGHDSIKTTEQYSHHDPSAHADIKRAWSERLRGRGRMGDARSSGERG
ncbi:site-specific integrase [Actinomadura sp. ATCC 31491]|uniref:Site-specific integrase n=1 Tax=Actinomadura luzonensis TaxID=2805427 RepID=A0ABT0G588_9ACTN|nr:site-specific integrase [Actinomadura luzonensis]MCK2219771.1 site-specific integrase [Actinomadura luzonensis]